MRELIIKAQGYEFSVILDDIYAPVSAPMVQDHNAPGFSHAPEIGHFKITTIYAKRDSSWRAIINIDDDLMDDIYEACEDILENEGWAS